MSKEIIMTAREKAIAFAEKVVANTDPQSTYETTYASGVIDMLNAITGDHYMAWSYMEEVPVTTVKKVGRRCLHKIED